MVKRKPKPAEQSSISVLDWIGATVTSGESHLAKYRQNANAAELIRLAQGLPAVLAWKNAQVCASQTLRLYRDGKGADPSRRVGSKRLRYMRDGRAGSKAAEWSQTGGEAVEVVDHPVLRLLNRPNRWQTGRALSEVGFWFRQITGDSYEALLSEPGSPPHAMGVLSPVYTEPQPDDEEFIRCYYFSRSREETLELPPESVLHRRHALSPTDPYHGVGWLHNVRAEARMLATDAGFDIAFAERGYQPPFVIQLEEGYASDREKTLLASLAKNFQGWAKMHLPLLLWKAKYQPTMTPPKELQTVEKRRENRLAILAAAGVPESMYALNDANLASAQQGYSVQYLDATIRPMCNSDAEQLTELLLPLFGVLPGEMWFAYDNPVPENESGDADRMMREVTAGVRTVDEYRAEFGLPPMPPKVAPLTLIQREKPDEARDEPADPEPETTDSEPPEKPAPTKRVNPASLKSLGWWDAPPGSCCEAAEHKSVDLPPAMLADFTAWYERVIRASASAAAQGAPVDVPDDGLEALFSRHLPDLMRQAAMTESRTLGQSDPADFAGDVNRILDSYVPELSAQIRGTTQERVREIAQVVGDTLREGMGDGASADQIAEEIASLAPEEAGYMAERVVRTETAYASTQGRQAAWTRYGVSEKDWLLSPGACEVCSDLFNQRSRVKTEEAFARAGETFGGYTLRRDCYGPPLHPNDRCSMMPVVEGFTDV